MPTGIESRSVEQKRGGAVRVMLRIAVLAVLLVIAAAAGLLARRIYVERTPPAGAAEFFIGSQKVLVPRAMVRDPDLRNGGALNRIDLALLWPDLRGAAAATKAEIDRGMVFIGLEDAAPRAATPGDIDPTDRPGELYARFLAQEAWSNPGGLVMRRFRAGTPYEGEELFVSSPDERVFSARCPIRKLGNTTEDLCLWQTRITGMELQVRFSPRLLVEWQALSGGVRALVTRLKAR
ncbi:MAG TPA: hypothetical protein PK812_05635 [Beijerinckiaceae bacterium]|nr:hypothetical protein [Beijerinckiaceae bacterium]